MLCQSVGKLKSLKALEIAECPITGDALKCLVGLQSLEVLSVSGPDIDDGGALHLAELPNLRVLNLDGTAITNASLPRLLKIGKLEDLTVPFPIQMTRKLREELEALPRLQHLKTADGEFRTRPRSQRPNKTMKRECGR